MAVISASLGRDLKTPEYQIATPAMMRIRRSTKIVFAALRFSVAGMVVVMATPAELLDQPDVCDVSILPAGRIWQLNSVMGADA